MTINLTSLAIGKKEAAALDAVLKSHQLASGPRVLAFQSRFAKYCHVPYAVCTSNGTSALHTCLESVGIKKNDKVLTTPLSFIATANAILHQGAVPVFCDIDESANISPEAIERALKKDRSIKAIIIVHLYGLPCDMKAIMALTKKYNIKLIEDCAQAVGASYQNKKVGSFGDAAAFSFYATKNMTTGEGGMVLAKSKSAYQKACRFINHGRATHTTHVSLGYNYRMTDLQAALGMSQLDKIDPLNKKRREHAHFFSTHLKDLPFLILPKEYPERTHVFHQYTLRLIRSNRTHFMAYMKAHGIPTGVYYPIPIHRQPLYRQLGYTKNHLPIAERMAKEVVSLPIHPGLTQKDREQIVEAIRTFKP